MMIRTHTILLLCLVGLTIGCAKGNSPSQSAATIFPDSSIGDSKQEINRRYAQIVEAKNQLQLDAIPSTSLVPFTSFERICETPNGATCRDSCRLADSICDNAEAICRIATQELRGDNWAAEKCEDAKQTCTAAKSKCCACR